LMHPCCCIFILYYVDLIKFENEFKILFENAFENI